MTTVEGQLEEAVVVLARYDSVPDALDGLEVGSFVLIDGGSGER